MKLLLVIILSQYQNCYQTYASGRLPQDTEEYGEYIESQENHDNGNEEEEDDEEEIAYDEIESFDETASSNSKIGTQHEKHLNQATENVQIEEPRQKRSAKETEEDDHHEEDDNHTHKAEGQNATKKKKQRIRQEEYLKHEDVQYEIKGQKRYISQYDKRTVYDPTNGYHIYIKTLIKTVPKILIGQLLRHWVTKSDCSVTFKVDCAIYGSSAKVRKVKCDKLSTSGFPPRMHLVFFEHEKVDIFPAELVMPIIFAKCGISKEFFSGTAYMCKLLADTHFTGRNCWTEESMMQTKELSDKYALNTDLNCIAFLSLIIYGFITMAIFKLQLLRQRRFYV